MTNTPKLPSQQIVGMQQQQLHPNRPASQQQPNSQQQIRKSDLYLNQQISVSQQQQMNKNHTMMQPPIPRPQDFNFDTSTAATPIQPQSGGDTELSDIVNSVIDLLPEYQGNSFSGILTETSSSMSTPTQPQSQEDINKDMAINAITKSLMQIESTAYSSSPPAYSMHNVNTQSGQQVWHEEFGFLSYSWNFIK